MIIYLFLLPHSDRQTNYVDKARGGVMSTANFRCKTAPSRVGRELRADARPQKP